MYFEFQYSSNVFTRIVRNRLRALQLCLDHELDDKDDVTRLAVNEVAVGDTTLLQRERQLEFENEVPKFVNTATNNVWIFSPQLYTYYTVPYLQVRQQIFVHLVKAADLDVNGPNPTPPYQTWEIHPVFNVALEVSNQTQGGGPLRLTYSLAYIDFGILNLVLSAERRIKIEQMVAKISLPPMELDLEALKSAVTTKVSAINAGITCDPSGTFVALRVDFDVYASPVAVTPQFFTEPPESLLGGRDWAMLVDAHLIVADVRQRATKALTSQSSVRLQSGPTVTWDPGGPAVDIDAGVELVDACPFFVDNIDMDVDVDIRVALSVPQSMPNTLRSHFHLTGSPADVGEEIACALTGALLWPFIGPLFLQREDVEDGVAIYFAGLYTGWIPVFVGLLVAMETKKLSEDISNDLGGNCRKIDDENYQCDEVFNIVMELVPTFNSRLEVDSVHGVSRGPVLAGTVSNLRDYPLATISSVRVCPFAWQVLGRCTGNGRSNFRIGNQASVSVYGTAPLRICKAYVLFDPAHEFTLTHDDSSVTIVPAFNDLYVASPYSCRLRLVTNRGVRTLTLQPPTTITDAERETLETERLGAHLSCYYWEKIATPLEKIAWLPDPPPDSRSLQFWQIVVRGLQEEEEIAVQRRDRSTVMTARPSPSGVAHMTLLFSAEDAPNELELELRGRRHEQSGQREMTVQQVAFEHRATLRMDDVRAMRIEGAARNRRLIASNDEAEVTWDITNPRAPAVLRSLLLRKNNSELDTRGSELVIHAGKRMGEAPSPHVSVALGVLADRCANAEALGSPRVGGLRKTLYVRMRSNATLYDISVPSQPRELQVFNGAAWFEFTALGGEIIARHDPNSGQIDVYAAVRPKACV